MYFKTLRNGLLICRRRFGCCMIQRTTASRRFYFDTKPQDTSLATFLVPRSRPVADPPVGFGRRGRATATCRQKSRPLPALPMSNAGAATINLEHDLVALDLIWFALTESFPHHVLHPPASVKYLAVPATAVQAEDAPRRSEHNSAR